MSARSYTRRQLMAGIKEPYTAKIEYLKGDGNAYIVLPFSGSSDKTTFEIEFIATNSKRGYDRTIIGSRASTNTRFCWVSNPNFENVTQAGYGNTYHNIGITIANGDLVNIKTEIFEGEINYTVTNITRGTSASYSWNTYVFAVLDFVYLFWSGGLYKSQSSITKCIIENDGVAAIDCFPVRIDNVGYLYDKVSKKLFGNAGTGNFILGPDK